MDTFGRSIAPNGERLSLRGIASNRFARQSHRVNDGQSNQLTGRLIEALDAIYRTFEMPPPSAINGCPCCIDTRSIDILLTTPLRQISGQALWRYVTGAFLTVGDKRDFQYLLPRILDVSVFGSAPSPEIVLGKLALAEWRSWAADEQLAIEAFVDAWFEQALARDLAHADEGGVCWDVESVLCGGARAGFRLERWLLRLTELDAAPVLAAMQEQFPSKPSGYWADASGAFHKVRAFLDKGRA